ncbi:MAG: hypothetical protein JXB17_10555 [Bacteroidales bacterium]|nr:hypothetical protein [Bacteroidales bacterium]
MKKLNIILTTLIIGFTLNNCDKEPDTRMPELKKGLALNMKIVEGDSYKIDIFDPMSFSGSFMIDAMFEGEDENLDHLDVILVRNNDVENKVVYQAGITSLPATVDVTVQMIIDALPQIDVLADFDTTDNFNFYADIYLKDGTYMPGIDTIPGFTAYSADLQVFPNNSIDFTFLFVCPLVMDDYIGTFDFHDVFYPSEDVPSSVIITEDPEVEYGIIIENLWPASCVAHPVKATIDPENLVMIIEQQIVTDEIWGAGYMMFPYMELELNTCDKSQIFLGVSFSFELWGGPYYNPISLVKN